MENAADKEGAARTPEDPFSADPVEARKQLEAMRPSLFWYFQSRNVPPSHDEWLVDETIDAVWDRYCSGADIRYRKAYTRQVAASFLEKYIKKGYGGEVQPHGLEGEASELGEFDDINKRLDEEKKLACVEWCRRTLVERKKFSQQIMDAVIEYLSITGQDKERRDSIAARCGMSRLDFEQVVQKVKAALRDCVANCLRRPRVK